MDFITVPAGGARLAAEVAGQGTCVVLLHAGIADRRMWTSAMAALSSGFRCIAYDRRGFGLSTSPDEPFRHIDDLDAVMTHLGCGKAHLIGSSQGGRIAIDFALSKPSRVASLVLVAAAVSGAPAPASYPAAIGRLMDDLDEAETAGNIDSVNAIEAHLWLDGPEEPEGRVAGPLRQLFLDMNAIALRHAPLTREAECEPAFDRLREISHPALVIWGDADFPHIRERSRRLASTIPNARSLGLAGCAHLPNLEQPELFNAAVTNFLKELPTPAA